MHSTLKTIVLTLCVILFTASVTLAADWILAANSKRHVVSVIDAKTNTVKIQFLGELGTAGGGVFDIAVTPNGKTGLISNFGDSKIFVFDISNPEKPFVLGRISMPMFAEDIAVTADSKYALVTDGGFSNHIVVIDIPTRKIVQDFKPSDIFANGITVAPDGTVVTVDYFSSKINVFTLSSTGKLSPTQEFEISSGGELLRPVNVGIAPDGKTVILCGIPKYLGVYLITAPGVLKEQPFVTGLSGSSQSVAFSDDGRKAFVLSTGGRFDRVSVWNITSPGVLTFQRQITVPMTHSSQLFGVDVMAVANNKLFVGNMTLSGLANYLVVVNLSDYSRTLIRSVYPAGVTAIP